MRISKNAGIGLYRQSQQKPPQLPFCDIVLWLFALNFNSF